MNWNPRRFTSVFAAVLIGFVFIGCNGSSTPRLTSLNVTPSTATITGGGTQQFTATGVFSNGTTMDETATVGWTSSNMAVATIATGGLATGAAVTATGTTNITATMGGITSNPAVLTVNPSSVLLSIDVTPHFPTLNAGGMQQFTAMGTYSNGGGTKDITGQVTWASKTPGVATISASGLATAVANGASIISATLGTVVGQTTLTVGAPVVVGLQVTPNNPTVSVGSTDLFTAVELFSNGTTQPALGAITWTSDTTATATIGMTTGLAQVVGTGTATITAAEFGTAFTGTSLLTAVAPQARFAYVANINGTLNGFTVTPSTGVFMPLTVPAATSQQVILHPSGHFLYSIDGGSSLVSVYDVNSTTGALTLDNTIPAQPVGSNSTPAKGVIDRTGSFFFAVSNGNTAPIPSDALYAYKINQATGALTAVAGSPFSTNLNTPVDVLIAHQSGAANDYLYVINEGLNPGADANTVAEFSIDPTSGVPTALATPTIATGNTPLYSAVDPSGTHLYVPNDGDNTVSVFTIAANGTLSQPNAATAITDGTTPAQAVYSVAVDPSDKYLYVVDSPNLSAPGSVYSFSIGASGVIGASLHAAYATGNGPIDIVIDPSGVLAVVDDNGGNSLSPFALGTGGLLTAYTLVNTDAAPQFLVFYTAAAGQ